MVCECSNTGLYGPIGVNNILTVSLLINLIMVLIIIYKALLFIYQHHLNQENLKKFLEQFFNHSNYSDLGPPLLAQRTIVKQLQLKRCINSGKYSKIWLAEWSKYQQQCAVKILPIQEEISWFHETEIYRSAPLRHDNILGFIAADVKEIGSLTQLILITDYHERGSLHDYLQSALLSYRELLAICSSIASGIAYLHLEILGTKPSIAHRNIKSQKILVKRNGDCVIADFGLAACYSSETNEIDVADFSGVETHRYMAPEVLNETLDKNCFEAFKKADMYSVGLVFWEACRRCETKSSNAQPYALPYQNVFPDDPSDDDMYQAVCVKGLRPVIPKKWEEDSILSSVTQVMSKCWCTNPAIRLTASQVKEKMLKKKSLI